MTETLAALREFPTATGRSTLRRALVTAAQPVAIAARSYAPDDPRTAAPDLKSSIAVTTQMTSRARRQQPKASEVEVFVGPTKVAGRAVLNYASNVEFGTFRAAPHPYLRPAWDRTKGLVQVILAKELTIEFERTANRLSKRFFKLR
ncbi:MAG TPA: HK97-gp10 family putative phage morphogenesis protein [Sphingomicrobium sp.]|nr:HK97-gp10 family putative phage morphogenesis protein [Sphingomicrobium sp.]